MKEDRTGLSVHFAGELDSWICLLLVLFATGAAWWLYRMETKKGASAPLDKLLPFLRAVAVALVVLTLAGPTLKNVSEKGERGRVLVFLDGSESMTIQDNHMSPGRKLLLAERHGWLPKDQALLDPTLYEVIDLLSTARAELNIAKEDPAADLNKITADFATKAKQASDMLNGKDYQVALPDERRGLLRHEVWEEVPGSDLQSLTNHPKFKTNAPDSTGHLRSVQSPVNVGDNFGRKISGKTETISFGSTRTTNAYSSLTLLEKTLAMPRKSFAFLHTPRPTGAKP